MPEKIPDTPAAGATTSPGEPAAGTNCVVLTGRVSSAPTHRALPSGAEIVTFRLSVRRTRTVMTAGSKVTTDWVDCSAWSARVRRSVSRWKVGDHVEVRGALRRRFYAAGSGSGTRLEVEVLQARLAEPPP